MEQKIYVTFKNTYFGQAAFAFHDQNLCALLFGEDQISLFQEIKARFKNFIIHVDISEVDSLADEIVNKINKNYSLFDIKTEFCAGTELQKKIWKALIQIPAGTTATYSEIAEKVGSPKAVRAVGTACNKNPIAIIVPCHRVVGKSANASDKYRWGSKMKAQLLDREKVLVLPEREAFTITCNNQDRLTVKKNGAVEIIGDLSKIVLMLYETWLNSGVSNTILIHDVITIRKSPEKFDIEYNLSSEPPQAFIDLKREFERINSLKNFE